MIFFVPQRFIPRKYTGEQRRYWNESVSCFILLSAGMIYSKFSGDIHGGLISCEWWSVLRPYLHGPPMCPLCGTLRSFIFMCRGDVLTALHYSFFGFFLFLSCILHGGLKFMLLHPNAPQALLTLARKLDRKNLFLIVLFGQWIVQLMLHYTGVFSWTAALQ